MRAQGTSHAAVTLDCRAACTPFCRHQRAVVRTSLATSSDSTFGLEEKAEAALNAAGPARSACWVGCQGLSFATGHEMGSVLVWLVPPEASGLLAPAELPACCSWTHLSVTEM